MDLGSGNAARRLRTAAALVALAGILACSSEEPGGSGSSTSVTGGGGAGGEGGGAGPGGAGGTGDGGAAGAGGEGGGGAAGGAGGEGGGVAICEPGATEPCYGGPPGSEGVGSCTGGTRTCNATGTAFGPCEGEVLPAPETCASPWDEDCDGQLNEEGAGCVCAPSVTEPCYEGAPGTEGVGICTGGTRTCNAQGTAYGPCNGQVLPSPEHCATPSDEDCDGQTLDADAGCVCAPGSVAACYTGSAGTQGVGICAAGTQPCTAQGTGYGPCAGEVLPDTEYCATSQDEDCDGQVDEAACTLATVVGLASTGGEHSCARLNDGRLKCWGWYYSLGLGDVEDRGDEPGEMGGALPAVDLGAGRVAVSVAASRDHTCAILDNGTLKCWGNNLYGQLGLGDKSARGILSGQMGDNLPAVDLGAGKAAVAIAAGEYFTCAIVTGGQVKCWGQGAQGKLGLGDTADRGDGPGEMGDALPAVDLGAGQTAVAIAAGLSHACAVLAGGQVKCWGSNLFGKLGLGDTEDRGEGPGEMGDALPAVDLGAGQVAVAVAAASNHSCALLSGGHLKCWGFNPSGQLGLGDALHRGDQPGEMGDALPALDLGTGKLAVALSATHFHSCAILDDGQLKCWGTNSYGQLGLGDTQARGDQPGETGDGLPAVDLGAGETALAVQAAYDHTCALLSDHRVKCWGANDDGELGLGDTAGRGWGPGQMGDNLPAVKLFSSSL